MKRDEVLAIFPDATKEQVDALLDGFGKEINPLKAARDAAVSAQGEAQGRQSELQRMYDELAEEAKGLRERVEAGMTAEQLLAAREEAAAKREREYLLKSNRLDARAALMEAGVPSEDLDALLDQLVTEDPERTAALARSIAGVRSAALAAGRQAAADEALKGAPGPHGGPGATDAPTSMQDFLKLDLKSQLEWKAKDPQILSRLR